MTVSQLDEIERSLAIRLPDAYRRAVCPYPLRAYEGNSDEEVWDDPGNLIELNRRLHEREGWPGHLFAVGEMDGAQTAIDLSEPNAVVWWIDRGIDAPGTGPLGQGFAEWADTYFADLVDDAEGTFDPRNDPPGTRKEYPSISLLGCLATIVGVAVVLAAAIFAVQQLL
jgi:hypothetical protein